MASFTCPRLGGEVELTEEREDHIGLAHPDLLPQHTDLLAQTLSDPDLIRRSTRSSDSRLVSRWFPELRGGKHIVAVVVTDSASGRRWLVTAYISRKLVQGDIEWQKS